MLVREVMTPDPITVHPSLDLPDAVHLMREKRFRRLPVTTHGTLVGIVTDRDLRDATPTDVDARTIWDVAYKLMRLSVADVMQRKVHSVRPDDPVTLAASLMHDHRIGGLPVVDGADKVVGIITETDILKLFMNTMGVGQQYLRITLNNTRDQRIAVAEVMADERFRRLLKSPSGHEITVVFKAETADDTEAVMQILAASNLSPVFT